MSKKLQVVVGVPHQILTSQRSFFSAALWTSRTIEILLYVCAVVLSNDENHAACTVSVSSGVFGFRIISKSRAKS